MKLLEIKNYFLRVKKASLNHLLKEFDMDKDILQDMLTLWIKKGNLKKIASDGCATRCSSCQLGCSALRQNIPSSEIYEWVG